MDTLGTVILSTVEMVITFLEVKKCTSSIVKSTFGTFKFVLLVKKCTDYPLFRGYCVLFFWNVLYQK